MTNRDEEMQVMKYKLARLLANIKKQKTKVHRLGASDYKYDGKRDGFIWFTQHLAEFHTENWGKIEDWVSICLSCSHLITGEMLIDFVRLGRLGDLGRREN